jgi:hypothetical protein
MMKYEKLFKEFMASDDTLRIYHGDEMIFSSKKDRLMPLMEYLKEAGTGGEPVVIFDKVIGNAAACLAVKANCRECFSPLGSELGVKTLKKHKIVHHLGTTVPYIMRDDGLDMCPMEKLSVDKTPEEFYAEMKKRVEGKKG